MKCCVATLLGIYVATSIAVGVFRNHQQNVELELPHATKPKVNYLSGKETAEELPDLPDLVYDESDDEVDEPATPK
ncbi:hypothetical protein JCM33374_g4323 [Metschnikowia sp. JCM 33374]|nr:hypothetical protein JCM33374_g4323 [Metschnikowia sp. JCM 33374]